MLFDVTRGGLVEVFGEDRLVCVPGDAFPAEAVQTEGARLLQTVGVPTGTLWLRRPDKDTGRLALVREVVHVEELEVAEEDEEGDEGDEGDEGEEGEEGEGVPDGVGGWPVIGWLLNAHLALDPASGAVYAVDADWQTVRRLHTDVSSLVQVTARFQRLLDEFSLTGEGEGEGCGPGDAAGDDGSAEEAAFERLEREVERVRRETGRTDPLPFRDEETVWSVVGDEIASGQRF
ncbi:SUKH-4 family immunity protein [Streptomyces sp. UH6]|uniref:SUKH-4 family immunity protein n=1 Tax=Streptomyces sp. UH6 TaxID=2748379 RepID=UPI0015D4C77F|nr:SUKH-4 family immunity protein [Streptomyces sp. UH6]NYV73902.1 SUKH-4 family immunity protein [Streptomyces sp. UH6]